MTCWMLWRGRLRSEWTPWLRLSNRERTRYPNCPMHIAARPPESVYLRNDRDTLEKRCGRWLKELARQSQATGFDLNAWIPAWEAGGIGPSIPGRN